MPSGSKRYFVTAFAYDKRGRLLAVGQNSYIKTHTLQAKYAKRARKPKAIFLHAEIDAITKAKARGKIHRLVVMRKDNQGKPANAKPCCICQLAIRDFGIKKVEHT